jgi:cyclic beta-1,2-glucan synthetase
MGWERKRGKLHELNLLLRGDGDTTFLPPAPTSCRKTSYVMTLDSDTRLMRDAVTKLVGKMHHPLNRPVIDEATGESSPAIRHPPAARHAVADDRRRGLVLPAHLLANRGIDPYVFTVSDVYQDLFGRRHLHRQGPLPRRRLRGGAEGPHRGEQRAQPRPAGRLARAARAGDGRRTGRGLSDPLRGRRLAPASLGAWRLAACCRSSSIRSSPFPALSRWKMVDNLRRSLTPIFWVLASIAGWTLLPFAPPRSGRRC